MSISGTSFQPPIRFHQVRPGETLATIAEKHSIDLTAIEKENPGIKGEPGDMLVLPCNGNTFKVS